jgi:hypothetical protein
MGGGEGVNRTKGCGAGPQPAVEIPTRGGLKISEDAPRVGGWVVVGRTLCFQPGAGEWVGD